MRILIATDYYPPFIGGGHRWAEVLARGLHARGHEVAVLTEWHGGMQRLENDDGWPVHRVRQMRVLPTSRITDTSQRHSPAFYDPVTAWDGTRVIDDFEPDLCVSFGWTTFSLAPALNRRRIPILLSAHDYGYFCPTRVMLHQGALCSGPELAKCLGCARDFYGPTTGTAAVLGLIAHRPELARSIKGLHTVSGFVDQTNWTNIFGPRGPLHHVRRYQIPPFVETPKPLTPDQAREVDSYSAQLPSEPFIMFAGALRTIKGVHVLIDAYRQLPESTRPPLVMLGARYDDTPTDLPAGAQIIESVPHHAVMAAWRRARIAVLPSIWPEPHATVTIEAIGSGVPTIATRIGGFPDIITDNEEGLLVEPGSVDELRAAMQLLLDDPGLYARLRTAGLTRAERFDPERVVGEYEAAIKELVDDHHRQDAPLRRG